MEECYVYYVSHPNHVLFKYLFYEKDRSFQMPTGCALVFYVDKYVHVNMTNLLKL